MEEQKNNNVIKSIINGIFITLKSVVQLVIVLFMIFALWMGYVTYFVPNYTINVNLKDNLVIVKQCWPAPDEIARISGWYVCDENADILETGNIIKLLFQSNIDGLLEYVNEGSIIVSESNKEILQSGIITNTITGKEYTVLVIPSSLNNKIVVLHLDALVMTKPNNTMGNGTIKLNVTL